MRVIPVGLRGTYAMTVKPEHLASQFKDAILPPVLATPIVVLIMENAALNTIRDYLDANEAAVGTEVNIKHLAASPVGATVRTTAKVIAVERRVIRFEVASFHGERKIGEGFHARGLVNVENFTKRLGME